MSTNQAPQLPAPYRLLTDAEYDAAYARLAEAAHRHGRRLTATGIHEALTEALAVLGVFNPVPVPDPDGCTAQYLPHDAEEFGPDLLGHWQQCQEDPGHGTTDHDSGDLSWDDGTPGAVPARVEGEA